MTFLVFLSLNLICVLFSLVGYLVNAPFALLFAINESVLFHNIQVIRQLGTSDSDAFLDSADTERLDVQEVENCYTNRIRECLV